jgi:hypothetical protein
MIFRQIPSILRIKGGAILQQERVDKGHHENRQRNSGRIGNETREALRKLAA